MSEQPEINRSPVRILKSPVIWGSVLFLLVLGVYLFEVYRLAFAAERLELSWANTIKGEFHVLQSEISFGSGGFIGGCSAFTLKRCISLSIDRKAQQYPEIFTKIIDHVTRPCDALVSDELSEISRGKSTEELSATIYDIVRNRNHMHHQKADHVYNVWRLREYFNCSVQHERRPTVKIVLNVVEGLSLPPKIQELTSGAKSYSGNEAKLSYRIVKYIP